MMAEAQGSEWELPGFLRPRLGIDLLLHICFIPRLPSRWERHPTHRGRAEQETRRGGGLDEEDDREVGKVVELHSHLGMLPMDWTQGVRKRAEWNPDSEFLQSDGWMRKRVGDRSD